MADVTIVSPSKGRAGKVKAFGAFGQHLTLVVPVQEEEAYRGAYPDAQIEAHPNEVRGIGQARQWAYDQFGDVFMVDDDVPVMVDVSQAPIERLDPDAARDVVFRAADTVEAMGGFMFGTSISANPLQFRPQAPFRMTGSMNGMSMGLLKDSKVWFPPDTSVLEDTWAAALNAYFHRFVFVDLRYALVGSHQDVGGVASDRTEASTLVDLEKAEAAFGEAIVRRNPDAVWAFDLVVPW